MQDSVLLGKGMTLWSRYGGFAPSVVWPLPCLVCLLIRRAVAQALQPSQADRILRRAIIVLVAPAAKEFHT